MEQDTKPSVEMVEREKRDISLAVNEHDDSSLTLLQSLKQNYKSVIFSILMATGPMAFGFDIIIVGVVTAFPAFLERFGELRDGMPILPSIWLSLWNASMQIGFMIGSVIVGWVADRFGRKISMMSGSIITMAGIAVVYTCDLSDSMGHRRGTFLAGKVIIGMGLSMMATTWMTYNSEIVLVKLRGFSLSLFQFQLVFGQLIAAVVAVGTRWDGLHLDPYCPRVPGMASPKERRGWCSQVFWLLYKPSQVEAAMVSLQSTLEHEKQEQVDAADVTWSECFKGPNFRRMRIIIFASIVQQFHGTTFVANGTYFMIIAGLSPEKSIIVLEIASGLSLAAIMISWFLVDYLGRRRTIMGCTALLAATWLSVGIAGFFSTQAALWYMGVMINLVMVFFNIASGPVNPIIASETSSVRLRAKANAVGFICNSFMSWVFNFCVPYIFNSDEGNLGGKTGLIFAALSVIAWIIFWFDLPEMKNRTYLELDEMFENKVKTRQFRKYKCQGLI
ncbi:general substrate transporter [Fusarium subglutinans]|uniref:General substrate transporter n=1 Tax=Gibberella subglutinans TaxID=42677 RepID=A0A8H5PB58_GIBSU|nr:general substrate transporter [Fusarium subglutinans]KAF5593501.1 general substrate transporter [Fusarium subglutinans]